MIEKHNYYNRTCESTGSVNPAPYIDACRVLYLYSIPPMGLFISEIYSS